MDGLSVTEMGRGGVYEMYRQKKYQKNGWAKVDIKKPDINEQKIL